MPVIEGTINTMRGAANTLRSAGAPTSGTSGVQSLAISGTPTGGTFSLTYKGFTTAPIAYNASAATVVAALVALPTIGAGGVTATGGALPGTPVVLTFAASLASLNVATIAANGALLTGGSTPAAAVTVTTAGVDATHRGATKGQVLQDEANGVLYQNTSSTLIPTWTKVSTE